MSTKPPNRSTASEGIDDDLELPLPESLKREARAKRSRRAQEEVVAGLKGAHSPALEAVARAGVVPTAAPSGERLRKSEAVIYVRVSGAGQTKRHGSDDGYSIPQQLDSCRRKAEALGLIVVEEFIDRAKSARSAQRPELQRLGTCQGI